jgi:hypothetical protein
MANHNTLRKAALDAIHTVFSDRSVSQRDTLHSLRDIRDDLEILIDAVESDLRNKIQEEE